MIMVIAAVGAIGFYGWMKWGNHGGEDLVAQMERQAAVTPDDQPDPDPRKEVAALEKESGQSAAPVYDDAFDRVDPEKHAEESGLPLPETVSQEAFDSMRGLSPKPWDVSGENAPDYRIEADALMGFLQDSERGELPADEPILNGNKPFTWLTDSGLRGLFLNQKLTRENLEALLGISMYRAGPHPPPRIIADATESFGYYNPAFVQSLATQLEVAAENVALRAVAQLYYDAHLKPIARAYAGARAILDATELLPQINQIKADYIAAMREGALEPGAFGNPPYMALLELSRPLEEAGLDPYDSVTGMGFWVRRELDGTAPQFRALMERALALFDPQFGVSLKVKKRS
ncbi:putative secreted protein [Magnetofaba australis IT-1]|uniref:Putative secreted protein n=1 Tax=Magnetofaba australis IT-1 TaxID=1434232 RepID=A0A1Y2K4P8_9PROT|nr:putative secreted protein [Magnetofaba australis IT-1]